MKIFEISAIPKHSKVLSLLENRQQYSQMMNVLVTNNILSQDNVDNVISTFRKYYKRNDRIVWAIYWYRLQKLYDTWLYASLHDDEAETKNKISNLYAKMTGDRTPNAIERNHEIQTASSSFFSDVNMEHISTLFDTIPQVNELIWDKNTNPSVLIRQINEMERKWREDRRRHVEPEETDKIILSYDNGKYGWVLLDREYCRTEGDAMGHCGNTASALPGDQILSFRELHDATHKPHLTFILRKGGMLGEMKGFANRKPDPKYHPYIVDLLKQDFIKGLAGGGYAPDQNFELEDLDEASAEQLLSIKPSLGGATYIWEANDRTYSPEIGEMMRAVLPPDQFEYINTDKGEVILKVCDSLGDIADAIDNDTLSYLAKYDIFGGYNHFEINYSYLPEDKIIDIYDNLSPDIQNRIREYLIEQDLWDEYDPMLEMIKSDDELYSAFRSGVYEGERAGEESDMYEYVIRWLERESGFRRPTTDDLAQKDVNEDSWVFAVDASTILEDSVKYREPLEEFPLFDYLKDNFIEPRYGFDGFDLDVATERTMDELNDLGIDY